MSFKERLRYSRQDSSHVLHRSDLTSILGSDYLASNVNETPIQTSPDHALLLFNPLRLQPSSYALRSALAEQSLGHLFFLSFGS